MSMALVATPRSARPRATRGYGDYHRAAHGLESLARRRLRAAEDLQRQAHSELIARPRAAAQQGLARGHLAENGDAEVQRPGRGVAAHRLYTGADAAFATHETVKHSAGEYVRGDVHTNSAEGFFGVFKKGMTGVYQHCGEKYLNRYLTEFEFRHNTRAKLGFNDGDRAALSIKGAVGKRLTLRQPKGKLSPA